MARVIKSTHNTKYSDGVKKYADGGLVESLGKAAVSARKTLQKITDPQKAAAREQLESEQKQREAMEAEEKRKDKEYLQTWGTPRVRPKSQYTGGQ